MTSDVIIAIAIGIGVAAFTIVLVVAIRSERRRKARLDADRQVAAEATGFGKVEDPKAACEHWNSTHLTGGNRNIVCAYVQPNAAGSHTIALLQHEYLVSTGKSSHMVRHRVAVTPVFAQWPYVRLTAENSFTRLASRFGFRDLEVEDQQFNDRWRIKTKDRGFAELLLCPTLQEILRDGPTKRVWLIEDGYLNLIESGELRAEDFETLPRALREVIDAIPEELGVWMPTEDGAAL